MVPDAAKPAHNQIKFQEAMGNIFLMGLAGSATTADTTHFALVLLALHQDAQDWVLEELDEVMADLGEDAEKWDYKAIFPRLTRIRAVMSETLRLYPVSPVLPKWTADRAQTLHYAGKPLHLPAGTVTVLSFPAVQYNPQYWGADAGEFRPQRWESSGAVVGGVPEGAFAPFSKGARSCLGKRFSESEFVSVLGSVLRRHRVELQVGEGETVQGVQERARSALAGAKTYLTLYVGDDVPLVWKKR
ncbi:cytochrome P450 [Geopyxis carbonaria]|nr:cytochrome P450 [Geopyxis carbonaria]